MFWHAEPASLILRGYSAPGGYEAHLPFSAVLTAQLLGPDRAFLAGGLRLDGKPLTPADWRDLARLLREQHSVQVIEAIRSGRRVSWPTGRAVR